jgi:hypothetical protein
MLLRAAYRDAPVYPFGSGNSISGEAEAKLRAALKHIRIRDLRIS